MKAQSRDKVVKELVGIIEHRETWSTESVLEAATIVAEFDKADAIRELASAVSHMCLK